MKIKRDAMCSGFRACLTQSKHTVNGSNQNPICVSLGYRRQTQKFSLDPELNQGNISQTRGVVGRISERLLRAYQVRDESRLFLSSSGASWSHAGIEPRLLTPNPGFRMSPHPQGADSDPLPLRHHHLAYQCHAF